MQRWRLMVVLFIFLMLSACQNATIKNVQTVNMYNRSADLIGTAKLSEQSDGVKVKLKLEGLKPGLHGIHVHEYAICKGPDFKKAGSHLSPEGKEHGLMNPKGAHLGDMPNIEADDEGKVETDVMVQDATLLSGKKSLLKGEGTSLIINEHQDDGTSQPSGKSGQRIACGVIKANSKTDKKQPTDPTETSDS